MLPAKAIAAVVLIWIVGAILGSLFEMSYPGAPEQSKINTILFYNIATVEGSYGATELSGGPLDYVKTIWELATFDFAFITGEAEIGRWLLFGAFSAYVVYGSIMTVISILRGSI